MKRPQIILGLIMLILLLTEIDGGKSVCIAQETKGMQSQNAELAKRLYDIECEIRLLRSEQDILILGIDSSNIKDDAAISRMKSYEETGRTEFMLARIAFLAVFGGSFCGGLLLWRYLKKRCDEITKQTVDVASRSLKKSSEGIADQFTLKALDTWNEYERETDLDKKKNLLPRILRVQRIAKDSIEEGFGIDLSKLSDREIYTMIMIWQNMAYFLALAEDMSASTWAIEKAKHALEWGTGEKPFEPPAELPITPWIDTYFFVLMKFDIPRFRKEWVENYKVWRGHLEEHDPEFIKMYDRYFDGITQDNT